MLTQEEKEKRKKEEEKSRKDKEKAQQLEKELLYGSTVATPAVKTPGKRSVANNPPRIINSPSSSVLFARDLHFYFHLQSSFV